MKNKRIPKYFREYKWSNIFAMIRNNKSDPKICDETSNGKLVVITGATSGIGYLTARKYASMGADLLCINRNPERSEALKKEIVHDFGVRCEYIRADLSALDEIKRAAKELNQLQAGIDVLIHNAGIYLTKRETTADGLEKVLVIQYLASFLLNYLLMDKLKAQKSARIIMVNSEGHRFAAWGLRLDDLNWEKRRYTGLKSYGSAKTAQLLSMLVFNERFEGTGVSINAVHPGAVKTDTGQENGPVYRWFKRNMIDRTLRSPEISAEALYHLGASKEMEGVSGKFYNLTTEEVPAPPALDKEVAYELWEKSLDLGGLSAKTYDTIIVGGGIAGLTAAAYLSRARTKVLLIEKNRECGGLVNSFVRNGFHFDAGVRALEDAGIVFPLLKDLGIQLDVVRSKVSLGIENKIIHIEDLSSLEEYRDLLTETFPESEGEIDEVLRIIRTVMKHMDVLYGIENPVFKDLKRDREFIFKKLLPWLPRFLWTVRRINGMNIPVEAYLTTILKNRSLRDMISQHFFKNTPVFFALSYFSLYLDYFYPKGGVGKLSEALKNKILEWGGEIKTETRIVQVAANKRLLKDQNNRTYQYGHLIWAADLKTLYKITETEDLSPRITKAFNDSKNMMLKNRGGDSVFSLFLGVDEPLESFRGIANGHFFYTPSKIGLGDTRWGELDHLLNNFEKIEKKQILAWLDKFTRLNTYEISVPGLKDPELVPPGQTGLIISFLAEYDLFRLVQEAGWLDEFISELEDRVLRVISGSVYPMLKDKIVLRFSFSPLSIEKRVGSSEGAITGWSFQKNMPVVNKIQSSARSVQTPLPSVFQAGQWAYSPAGVPMSILTGKLAADKALKKAGNRK